VRRRNFVDAVSWVFWDEVIFLFIWHPFPLLFRLERGVATLIAKITNSVETGKHRATRDARQSVFDKMSASLRVHLLVCWFYIILPRVIIFSGTQQLVPPISRGPHGLETFSGDNVLSSRFRACYLSPAVSPTPPAVLRDAASAVPRMAHHGCIVKYARVHVAMADIARGKFLLAVLVSWKKTFNVFFLNSRSVDFRRLHATKSFVPKGTSVKKISEKDRKSPNAASRYRTMG